MFYCPEYNVGTLSSWPASSAR